MSDFRAPNSYPTPWPHRGPTLASDPNANLGEPKPLCAECPAGWWYKVGNRLECFCTQFRSVMFGPRNPAVTACDAREEAIRELPGSSRPT